MKFYLNKNQFIQWRIYNMKKIICLTFLSIALLFLGLTSTTFAESDIVRPTSEPIDKDL